MKQMLNNQMLNNQMLNNQMLNNQMLNKIEQVARTFADPSAMLIVDRQDLCLRISSDKSLYRLATVLDGAVELCNLILLPSAQQIFWKKRSRTVIELEVI